MGALIVLLVLAVAWAYRGDRAVQNVIREAAARWAEQNQAVDAERACACGAVGQVRHASVAIGGSYVWWSCWEHRWWNGGERCKFFGPGLPEGGVSGADYFRWHPVACRADGTWQHAEGALPVPLADDYQPGAV